MAAFAAARGFTEEWAIDAMHLVAGRPGTLRNVRKLADQARLFAGNGAVEKGHVAAALWQEFRMEAPI